MHVFYEFVSHSFLLNSCFGLLYNQQHIWNGKIYLLFVLLIVLVDFAWNWIDSPRIFPENRSGRLPSIRKPLKIMVFTVMTCEDRGTFRLGWCCHWVYFKFHNVWFYWWWRCDIPMDFYKMMVPRVSICAAGDQDRGGDNKLTVNSRACFCDVFDCFYVTRRYTII